MENSEPIRCRVAACREALDDGKEWSFYLINDSGAELHMELSLRVRVRGREVQLQFEFPKLYLKRNLKLVDGLDKPGWQVAAEGRDG